MSAEERKTISTNTFRTVTHHLALCMRVRDDDDDSFERFFFMAIVFFFFTELSPSFVFGGIAKSRTRRKPPAVSCGSRARRVCIFRHRILEPSDCLFVEMHE